MAYTSGTLHINVKDYGASAVVSGRATITCEQSTLIKDPTDQTVGFVGPMTVELVNGELSQALPPSTGMDPEPTTYQVELQLDGFPDIDAATGVEIFPGQVTELFNWLSVVPVAGQPNFSQQMQQLVDIASSEANAAANSADAAAQSALEVVGDLGDAVNLGDVSGALNLSGYVLGSQVFRMRAVGSLTLAPAGLPVPPVGLAGSCSLRITQDPGPSRTLTLDPAILTPYGLDPALSTAPGAIDVLHLLWDGATWGCYVAGLALA